MNIQVDFKIATFSYFNTNIIRMKEQVFIIYIIFKKKHFILLFYVESLLFSSLIDTFVVFILLSKFKLDSNIF